MSDYLEGALTPRDHARFEVHLAGCGACLRYLDQMRVTVATLGYLEADALDDVLKRDLIELHRRWHSS